MPKKQSKQSSSSSSDSEDDERMRQLKEATVSFDQITCVKATSSDVNKKSKRFTENEPQEDDDYSFNMTPEFQEFVAKKLRSKLDESIELIDVPKKKKKHKKSKKLDNDLDMFELFKGTNCNTNEAAIQLLHAQSNDSHKSSKKEKNKKIKSKNDSSSDSESELAMLREAAVEPNFIYESSSIQKHKAELLIGNEQKSQKSKI